MNIVRDFPIELDLDTVLRGQGADAEKMRKRPQIVEMYAEAIREAAGLIKPAIAYNIYPVREVRHNALVLQTGKILRSRLVAELLASAREVAVAVATIGGELDQQVSAYFSQQQPLRAIALDAAGVAAVDKLIEHSQQIMETEAANRELKASIPLSPGMSQLCSLDEQRVIFDLLPARQIGVSLTSAAMMAPVKSASMIFGLGANVLTKDQGSQCDFCSARSTCRSRKN